MKNILMIGCLCVFAVGVTQSTAMADDQVASATTSSSVMPSTRYGLFGGLDHRSWYNDGNFPEPFLVDDSGLEINEARLDWLHTEAGSQHSDIASAEVEKGFGLATLELRVPFERVASAGQISQGVGNMEVGARHPFYQFVLANGFLTPRWGRFGSRHSRQFGGQQKHRSCPENLQ